MWFELNIQWQSRRVGGTLARYHVLGREWTGLFAHCIQIRLEGFYAIVTYTLDCGLQELFNSLLATIQPRVHSTCILIITCITRATLVQAINCINHGHPSRAMSAQTRPLSTSLCHSH